MTLLIRFNIKFDTHNLLNIVLFSGFERSVNKSYAVPATTRAIPTMKIPLLNDTKLKHNNNVSDRWVLTHQINRNPVVYFIFEFLDVYNGGGMATSVTMLFDRKTGISTRSTDNLISSFVHESGKHNAHNMFSGPAVKGFLWKIHTKKKRFRTHYINKLVWL